MGAGQIQFGHFCNGGLSVPKTGFKNPVGWILFLLLAVLYEKILVLKPVLVSDCIRVWA
tara:strand:- start:480 stop:656 length:177 start_codon:yes stop_codon:yes gene_type:complete